MTTTTSPVLNPETIYLCGQEFVCGTTRCAGSTAVFTGSGLHGEPISPVTAADVAEWASYDLGPLVCTCGALTATGLDDSRGRAITKRA